jgi:hypothetical protein
VAIGLAGGLLAGTAAGLALGVPGMTSAASPTSYDVASLVQQTDDTETTDAPATTQDTETPDAPAAPGDRWRETLQELVDDGTLTAEQADAVATHLAEQLPRRGDRMGHHQRPGRGGDGDMRFGHGRGVVSEALTDLLGVDVQDLRAQLRDGATLAEIATAQGIDPDAVVDALVGELGLDGGVGSTAEVAEGVYTGRIERRLDGLAKADAVGELARAEGIDLQESTAYSDSASDLPFLEAVGYAVAVNPDRRLRAVAAQRSWRVLRFHAKAFPNQ